MRRVEHDRRGQVDRLVDDVKAGEKASAMISAFVLPHNPTLGRAPGSARLRFAAARAAGGVKCAKAVRRLSSFDAVFCPRRYRCLGKIPCGGAGGSLSYRKGRLLRLHGEFTKLAVGLNW